MSENDFLKELQSNFIQSLETKLVSIETTLIELESSNDRAKIDALVRTLLGDFHSLKGNASALRFKSIEILCHNIEDFILETNSSELPKRVDRLLLLIDPLKDYLELYLKNNFVDDSLFFNNLGESVQNIRKGVPDQVSFELTKPTLNILAVGLSHAIMNAIKKNCQNHTLIISYAIDSNQAFTRLQNEKYDLIFSTYFMEPIDGITLCMSLKHQWRKKNLKFILLASQEVKKDLNLIHPKYLPDKVFIKDQDMYSLISDYVNTTFPPNYIVNRIAFVDDDPMILEMYKVESEKSGAEFLYLDANSDFFIDELLKFKADLIISDVQMPKVDIIDFAKNFLTESKMIFFTGDSQSDICKKLLKLGALAIYEKADIMTRIHEILLYLENSKIKAQS